MCQVFGGGGGGGGGGGCGVHQTVLYLQRLLGLTFFIIYFLHTP